MGGNIAVKFRFDVSLLICGYEYSVETQLYSDRCHPADCYLLECVWEEEVCAVCTCPAGAKSFLKVFLCFKSFLIKQQILDRTAVNSELKNRLPWTESNWIEWIELKWPHHTRCWIKWQGDEFTKFKDLDIL